MAEIERGRRRGRLSTAGVLALGLWVLNSLVAGCGTTPQEPEVQVEDTEILTAMAEAIQDEYRAEMIYEAVVGDFGPVRPFSNIIFAEERHSEAIGRLYLSRGLDVPSSQWVWDQIPSYPSVAEACQAGVEAEIANAEIYERYFDLNLPDDVRRVFESNRAASLNNHLPAFERCS